MKRLSTAQVFLLNLVCVCLQSCGWRDESVHDDVVATRQAFSNATVCRLAPGFCVLEADHEDATREALHFLRGDELNHVITANTLVDVNQASAAAHFDGCSFIPGMNDINDLYTRLVEHLDPDDFRPLRAQALLGFILHRVQDFYSHSNWVELRRVLPAMPRLVDSALGPWSAFPGRYERVAGIPNVLVVQGQSRPGLTPVLNPVTMPWPERLLVRFPETGQYGLASGAAGDPNRCPTTVPAHHDEFNKDHTGRRDQGFDEALALAVEQTRHEWCRLVTLVRREYGARGDSTLYDNWVEDVSSARCGPPADLEAIADSAPSATLPLDPGESRAYQIRVRNNGPAAAYGVTWTARFSGSIASLGVPTISTPQRRHQDLLCLRVRGCLPRAAHSTALYHPGVR